jgi:hypothetical protein
MAELDLRKEAARAPLDVPLGDVSEEERARALDSWLARMVSEHASARVFAALIPQMMRASLPRRTLRAVADMVGQELDHGVLCARVVRSLGGVPIAELPRLDEMPTHDDATPLAAVLRNIISVSCCSETVAVGLVGTERERARCAPLRKVLDQILSDEVKHARFGWKLVRELGPQLDPAVRDEVNAYLPLALGHQLDFHAPFLRMPAASDAAVGVGAPDGPSNWTVFARTMTETIVPGLDAAGFAANAAWAEVMAPVTKREGAGRNAA